MIGSAISFDPTRPVYEDYEGNVGLGYYTWMNGGKPITLAAANPVADLELADKLEKQNVLSVTLPRLQGARIGRPALQSEYGL